MYGGFQLVFTSDPRITDLFLYFSRTIFGSRTDFVFFPNGPRGWHLGLEIIRFPLSTLPARGIGENQANVKRKWKSAWTFDGGREEWDARTGMIIDLAAHV